MADVNKTRIKTILLIFVILLLIVLSIMGLGILNSESSSKMMQYWTVQQIKIDGNNIIDEFKTKSLSFLDNKKLLLPIHRNSKIAIPLKYSIWEYQRSGLFQGVIRIEDVKQSIFDGQYEIEILDHGEPQVVKLTSEKIEIYLKGIESFSLKNQTISTK